MKSIIEKIVLKLGDKSIELTPDEARRLHDELSALLGKDHSFNPVPFQPATPIIIEREVWPWRWTPVEKPSWDPNFTCGTDAQGQPQPSMGLCINLTT